MSAQQQKSGKPWSGQNKIPNIKEFVAGLDRDKENRDKHIDSQNQPATAKQSEQVVAHQNETQTKGEKGKTVSDPVTGHQVVIADVGKEYMKNVDNPQVGLSLPICH